MARIVSVSPTDVTGTNRLPGTVEDVASSARSCASARRSATGGDARRRRHVQRPEPGRPGHRLPGDLSFPPEACLVLGRASRAGPERRAGRRGGDAVVAGGSPVDLDRHRPRRLRQGRHAHRLPRDVGWLGARARDAPRGAPSGGRSRRTSSRRSASTRRPGGSRRWRRRWRPPRWPGSGRPWPASSAAGARASPPHGGRPRRPGSCPIRWPWPVPLADLPALFDGCATTAGASPSRPPTTARRPMRRCGALGVRDRGRGDGLRRRRVRDQAGPRSGLRRVPRASDRAGACAVVGDSPGRPRDGPRRRGRTGRRGPDRRRAAQRTCADADLVLGSVAGSCLAKHGADATSRRAALVPLGYRPGAAPDRTVLSPSRQRTAMPCPRSA